MREPEQELAELEAASLRRRLPVQDNQLINFSSNDYLGLSQHPEIKKSYQAAIEKYGSGARASRLICGNLEPHRELEACIADAKGTEAALTFATGYATALGAITAIVKKGDTVILDKLCHASLIDGARMSQATLRVFPHNNLKKLEALLSKPRTCPESRTLVITESIFSMDGDAAPLREIIKLTKKYDALLMVDEAHGIGILGKTGMGLAEELGVQDQIDFQMGTLGKAVGVAGGYIAASASWIDLLINQSRSLIYSTAPPPGQAAASSTAIKIIQSDEGHQLREQLWSNIHYFQKQTESSSSASAIIPWILGDSEKALVLAQQLRDHGLLVPAIRFPTVSKDTARLRITLSASSQRSDIDQLLSHLL